MKKFKPVKKSIAIILMMLLIFTLCLGSAFAGEKFSDIKGHWAEDAIVTWSDNGLIEGDNGKFRPNDNITRAEMATICTNLLNLQDKADNAFSDLKADAWYTDAILKCVKAGIIKGDGETVRPNDNMTREEAAVIIGRALGFDEGQKGAEKFSDKDKISSWALGYVNTMADKGYINGFEGKFNPAAAITRAEVVTIIDNTGFNQTADKVLKSTYIYTVADDEAVSGGIAIKGNKILAVGSMKDIAKFIDNDTEIIDYGDKMIMPGFVDSHTHSMLSETVLGVDVTFIEDQAQATDIIKKYIAENPDKKVIIGGGWYAACWGGGNPDKKYLDAATTELPIVLYDYDHHCTWVNSKALEMAGVDAAYAKKFNEERGQEYIVVDENGEPTGYLKDLDASSAVAKLIPEFKTEDLEYCINVWSEYGVTTINEMTWYMADDPYYDMITELEDNDRLNIRHMLTVDSSETDKNIEVLKARFNSDVARLTSLKTFMDGAGSTYTASMLKNYKGMDTDGGAPYKTAEEVGAIVEKADKHDLVTHFHACGDRAIRTVFDGYDIAVKNGVKLNPGFSIEHVDTIHPDDLNRPAELGISCNVTPDFMDPTGTFDTNPYLQVYDEDVCKELWNYGSLYKTGANVAFCTDSYFSSYSPFVQLFRATQRVMNDGQPVGGYLPEEKFDLKTAIECYTVNSARSCGMLDKVGTLEAGKYADIIVLDTNIIECTPAELFNAGVDVTYMNGREVYSNPAK
ncbi:MAG: amidohydrolase family protein [Bacillota bacterium]|jgi:predicted amidohydrolase YtcJ